MSFRKIGQVHPDSKRAPHSSCNFLSSVPQLGYLLEPPSAFQLVFPWVFLSVFPSVFQLVFQLEIVWVFVSMHTVRPIEV